jgi:ADP-ribosyl-[dinitrogen reductase] hydrolase
MSTNSQKLNALFAAREIQLNRGSIFDVTLAAKSPDFDFSKVEGMLLGLAIGDALGITTEAMLPSCRRAVYGELRDYIPNPHIKDPNQNIHEPRGFPSDDTQLAFWTLEQMIADRGFVPDHVAARFCRDEIFGIGSTTSRFLKKFKSGMPWDKSGPRKGAASNGALMRIAPMVIPHLRSGGTDLWVDTALSAMTTHNDTVSIAACLSFVAMLWELLDMQESPTPMWWLERYVSIAQELETGQEYVPRGGQFLDYQGPAWAFVYDKVSWAYRTGLSVLDACNMWYSGAYLLETLPSVIYILMRYANNLEEAIVRAVNDTKDNDTIAAIVGAAVGALHGKAAIPQRWIHNLSGRTTDRDDGRIDELIAQAKMIFWDVPSA